MKATTTTIHHYQHASAFLSACGVHLQEAEEVYNSVFLTSLQQEAQKEDSICYCSAVWEENIMMFALFVVKGGAMYTSYISVTHQQTIVPLLIKDFLKTPLPFPSLEAYEPTSSMIVDILDQCSSIKMKLLYNLWSYDIRNVHWSNRSLEIKNHESTHLLQATLDDLPLVVEWTQGFLQDIEDNSTRKLTLDVDRLCTSEITKKYVYILYYEGVPVSMSWKRRPLKHGCSLAFVYTPKQLRQKGYGAACVAMCTELFLEKYKYVTLFVMGHMNPVKNMYTGVGYQLVGKVGRYQTVELLNE